MGKEVASPYACLTVGYLEETVLFPKLLPANFDQATVQQIIDHYFRFVDDGITALPKIVQPEKYEGILNSMDPSVQFTITRPVQTILKEQLFLRVVFLSIKVYSAESGKISTDINYKETNTHDYLHYNSHHPTHIKKQHTFCPCEKHHRNNIGR